MANPYDETGTSPWLYRSGDLVRVNKDGELETISFSTMIKNSGEVTIS